jgi:hypothetical protein
VKGPRKDRFPGAAATRYTTFKYGRYAPEPETGTPAALTITTPESGSTAVHLAVEQCEAALPVARQVVRQRTDAERQKAGNQASSILPWSSQWPSCG